MFRYICLLCGLLFVFAGCGAKPVTQANTGEGDSLRQSLANYNNSCANIAFAQTKAKVAEADALNADGKTEEAKKANEEALELFKTEEPQYQQLNDANEAQAARVKEITTNRDAMDQEPQADPEKWAQIKTQVNDHLAKAQAAYENCDPITAKQELDMASDLLQSMGNTGEVVVEKTVSESGIIYTVKKGDCLWNIAGSKYSNPFMWPLIYWANKNQIKDPDLIFPGQNFEIVMQFTEEEQVKAVDLSKNRGPWSLYDNK